ncbi:hypothetical protein QO008_001167 [Peptoniphilus ivorii]|uniref:tryptophan transporter n=1 Tax=Aedoeadaptatus ivorii TaxID=54006 RepID=UPI0027823751|nr:tryptophan transporter [Peptoniphilus ivorii]MDQ0508708.1 hypothetical protein [Peptoniphilus ivorii]
MKTKTLVQGAIFIALGTMLHYVVPGFFNGMKPDFMLFFMIAFVLIYPDVKSALAMGVAMGMMAAVTTQFPGGQLPSLIDKIITALAVMAMARVFPEAGVVKKALVYFLATMVSGTIFLASAMFLVGLPGGAPFGAMFAAVVLPTAVLTGVCGVVFEKVVAVHFRHSRIR